jgi:hypothetical protein
VTRLSTLSIRLVPPPHGTQGAWPLDRLKTHLRAAGHLVESSDSGPEDSLPAPDVVHCFGLTVATDLIVETPTAPVLVTPVDGDALGGNVKQLDLHLLSAASAAVCSSSERAQLHRLGLPWFRTWVLPVAVDVDTVTRLGPMVNRTDRFRVVAELSGADDGLEDVLVAIAKFDDVEPGPNHVDAASRLRAHGVAEKVSEAFGVVELSVEWSLERFRVRIEDRRTADGAWGGIIVDGVAVAAPRRSRRHISTASERAVDADALVDGRDAGVSRIPRGAEGEDPNSPDSPRSWRRPRQPLHLTTVGGRPVVSGVGGPGTPQGTAMFGGPLPGQQLRTARGRGARM